MYRALLFSLALTLGAVAQPCCADPIRWPVTGDPAFVFESPPGWTVNYDQGGNAQFLSTDHATFVQLTMVSEPDLATMSTPDFAARVLKAAGAQPYTRTGTDAIAGHTGDSFYADMVSGTVHINLEVIVVKFDATHAAVAGIITRDNLLPAQTETLATFLAAIRMTELPVPAPTPTHSP